MVALHIITTDANTANEIVDFLFEEKLVAETISIQNVLRRTHNAQETNATLITGLTKALLFKHINSEIKRKFGHSGISIYSLPIVDMDAEQQRYLIQETRSV